MLRNLALLIGFIALATGIAYLLFQGDSPGAHQEALDLQAEDAVAGPTVDGGLAPAIAPATVSTSEIADLETTRTAVSAAQSSPSGFVLRLVDPDGDPVSRATVRVIWNATGDQRTEFANASSRDRLLDRDAVALQADDAGAIALETIEANQYALIEAHKGDLWGRLVIAGSDQAQDRALRLDRDLQLLVRVIDATGKPVGGVPVDMESLTERWRGPIMTVSSAAQTGIARFDHIQEVSQWDHDYIVALDALTRERISTAIDINKLPAEPIELVMPMTGTVTVKVLEGDWGLYTGNGKAKLRVLKKGASRDLSPFNHRGERMISADLVDGQAHFPHVEIGMDVQARASRDGSSIESSAFGSGPGTGGGNVEIEVRLGAEHPVVRLRAVNSSGAPIANTRLDVGLHMSTSFILSEVNCSPTTNEHGVFVVDVASRASEDGAHTLIIETLSTSKLAGKLSLPATLKEGINDLGDLVLEEPALFVGGRVVGRDGTKIGGAQLALRIKARADTPWRDLYGFSARADSEGRFEVHEGQAGSEFQIAAEAAGYASAWIGFQPGDQAVVVELDPEGKVSGVVLLDEGIPAELLTVVMPELRDSAEHLSFKSRTTHPAEDGTFELGELVAGQTRSLRINATRQSKALYSVDDLVVVAGETTADSRLNPIDLRGKLFLHEVELVLPTGTKRVSGRLGFREAGAEEFAESLWLSEASVSLLTGTKAIDISVQASGYRSQILTDVRDKKRVLLREAIQVTLILPAGIKLPEAPIHVKAALVPVEGTANVDWSGNAFDEQREISTRVGEPGELRVTWLVEQRSVNSSMGRQVMLEREQIVNVLDMDGDQRILLDLTQEEMDKLGGKLK